MRPNLIGPIITIVAMIFFIPGICMVSAGPGAIDNGLLFLRTTQNSDGSWGGSAASITSVFHSTAVVTEAFRYLGLSDAMVSDGVGWLMHCETPSVDYLSRRMAALAAAGINMHAERDALLAIRQADGGWGIGGSGSSDVLDSLLAERALRVTGGVSAERIAPLLQFLLAHQNPDGGWGYLAGMASRIHLTAMAVPFLSAYRADYPINSQLENAVDWLILQQNGDGGFGASVWETALVYSALVRATQAPEVTTAALDFMRMSQLPNGSWNDNGFETALALRALADARPNLTLSSAEFVFHPSTPVEGHALTVSAAIRNVGPVSAAGVVVRFYANDSLIGETVLAEVPGGGTGIAQVVWSTAGHVGVNTIRVVADPDDLIAEPVESDNEAGADVTVTSGQADLLTWSEQIFFYPPAPTEGDKVTVVAHVGNQGATAAGNIDVAFYEELIQPLHLIGGTQPISDLAPGDYKPVQVDWDTLGKSGSYTICVAADPQNVIPEGDELNNHACAVVPVAPRAELADGAISAMGASNYWPAIDEVVTLTADVTNKGLVAAPAMPVRFYHGEPGGAGSVSVGEVMLPPLDPGTGAAARVDWNAASGGEHRIYAMVDPDNVLTEGNELNNLGLTVLNVGLLPDLAIRGQDIRVSHTDLMQGFKVTVFAMVHNDGSAPAHAAIDFFDGNTSAAGHIGRILSDPIAPSSHRTIFTEWYPSAGDHTLIVRIDSADDVPELDENNNEADTTVTFTVPRTVLRLFKVVNGQREECYHYGAYETLEIDVAHQWEGVNLLTTVRDSSGTIHVPYAQQDRMRWSTSHLAPGQYNARVAIISQDFAAVEGTVIEMVDKAFFVGPSLHIDHADLRIDPTFGFTGQTTAIAVKAGLRNASNIAGEIDVRAQLLALDATPITEGSVSLTLLPTQLSTNVDVAQLEHTFGVAGDYRVRLDLFYGDLVLGSFSRDLTILPDIRINVNRVVAPDSLYPAQTGRTGITIELKGVGAP